MAAPTNYDQTNEWLAEVDRQVQGLVNILKGSIDVGQSGELGNLALVNTLSEAQIGNLSTLLTALTLQNVAGRETVGNGPRIMRELAYGLGVLGSVGISITDFKTPLANGFYAGAGSSGVNYPDNEQSRFGGFLSLSRYDRQFRLLLRGSTFWYSTDDEDGNFSHYLVYSSGNTTVDSNGFLKSASPIFRLSNEADSSVSELQGFTAAGAGAANSQADGVTATHDSVGVYTIRGSLGFAAEGWTIEIPQDNNGNRLCFIETEQLDDGTITVLTFSRKFDFDTVAVVAGEPMDIPDGRWIDLRLSMPEPPEPDDPEAETTDAA
ncbi:hypothetical protein [Vreelandella venusta]|uniref:phage tail fiber protein n=1 Tax=Vreelandella venusta TaxID=44935 RepID=UPI003AA81EBB